MSYTDAELKRQAQELSQAFTANPSYKVVAPISFGGYGGVFRIRVDGPSDLTGDFAIKRAFNTREAIETLGEEKETLRVCIF